MKLILKNIFKKLNLRFSDMLLESIIADALKLEAELIAKGNPYNKFKKIHRT